MVSQLGEFSEMAIKEFEMLAGLYAKWYRTFQTNLNAWMENASPAEWFNLESQDPGGKLKKMGFERVIKQLLASII